MSGKHQIKLIENICWLIVPLFVALAPVVSVFADNYEAVNVSDTLTVLVTCCVSVIAVISVSYAVLRNYTRTAVVSSVFIVLFWAADPIYDLISSITGSSVMTLILQLLVYMLLLSLVSRYSGKYVCGPNDGKILALFIGVIVSVPFAKEAILDLSYGPTTVGESYNVVDKKADSHTLPTEYPDIYLIILDAYGREDELLHYFGMSGGLAENLADMGFYIGEKSYANYPTTIHSITSLLNFDYVHNLFDQASLERLSSAKLKARALNSNVVSVLQNYGYGVVFYSTGFYLSDCTGYSFCVQAPSNLYVFNHHLQFELNYFERYILGRTIVSRLLKVFEVSSPYHDHRESVKYTLSSMSDPALAKSPKIVIAHVISPHEPFVFGENGEDVSPSDLSFSYQRVSNQTSPPESGQVDPVYSEKYRNQATYLGKLVVDAVHEILESSDKQPVIIVQGDHGPYGIGPNVRERRFAILNAYYLPSINKEWLYPEISPVNSFRIVLNHYFGLQLPYLPDVSYQASYKKLGEFQVAEDKQLRIPKVMP